MTATINIGETPSSIASHLAATTGVPQELVDELLDLHSRQWGLEDDTRVPDTPPEKIAAAKAEIDRCNERRHHLIDLIDAAVRRPAPTQPIRVYAETIGELCDRLLILDLKRRALSSRSDQAHGVTDIENACRHLAIAAAQLLDDMAAGRAVLPPRVGVKVYNGAALASIGIDERRR